MKKFLSWFWDWKIAKPYVIIWALGQLFILGTWIGFKISELGISWHFGAVR